MRGNFWPQLVVHVLHEHSTKFFFIIKTVKVTRSIIHKKKILDKILLIIDGNNFLNQRTFYPGEKYSLDGMNSVILIAH